MANNEFIRYLNKLNIDMNFRLDSQDEPIQSLNGFITNAEITNECLAIGGASKLCKQPEDNAKIKSNFHSALNNDDFIQDYVSHFNDATSKEKETISEGVEVVALLNFLHAIAYNEQSNKEFLSSPSEFINNFKVINGEQTAELSADVKDQLVTLVAQVGDIKDNQETFIKQLFALDVVSGNLANNANIIW
tara:strand:- start:291 stop:863 length:573 start_codon:yes stop_codon:yes gene_type:complete